MSEAERKGFLDRIMSEADESAHPFLQKIQEHIKIILVVVLSVLTLAAAYAFHSFWQERQLSRTNAQLEEIMALDDPGARMSELETFLGEAPERLKGAILLEKARISLDMEEYGKAADSFRQVGRLDREMRPVALLGRAKAYELMGEHGRALSILKEESEAIPDEFKIQYLNLLSFNAERAGEYSVALDAYERLKTDASGIEAGFIEYKVEAMRQKLAN